MSIIGERYSVTYDPLDQKIQFEGILRTCNWSDLKKIRDFVIDIHDNAQGLLQLDFRKMRYINSFGIQTLLDCLHYAKTEARLKVKIIGSRVLAWESKTLSRIAKIWDQIEYLSYDENFYASQRIIEQDDFIPLLRTQTRLLWPLEKGILVKHGLKPGMKIADVCCGCGDVALLIARELKPGSVLGVDHSEPAIKYAINLQQEFNVTNADFRVQDATALLIDDETYDFVICRLSIQIFSKPKDILRELYRITKPGGTIYITGEDYDMISGHPNEDSIRSVYRKAGLYGSSMGMDLYNGKKMYSLLNGLKLTDIKVDYIHVDTNNSTREDFSRMISSWQYFSTDTIGKSLKISKSEYEDLLKGYDKHIETINNPAGYTTWTVVAGSGIKKK